MAMLEVSEVSVSFGGVHALTRVSMSLNRGEILGLIGPNGAGKTTLFNCITGVIEPDRGRILFEGRRLGGLKPHKRARLGIARTFQNLRLFTSMTVRENLMVPIDAFAARGMMADALRLPTARYEEHCADERARAMLHFLGLDDFVDTPAGDLPVGLQRQVELGRALCLKPSLLLLDEPAAGLDSHETAALAALLPRIRERFGVTMLLVDHDMALVMRVCDWIYVLDFGQLLAHGTPAEIREHPAVIRAYLGEAVS
jgi:branched-chain amino acid transport system ATP-binding protein